jgi:hypothetical protein
MPEIYLNDGLLAKQWQSFSVDYGVMGFIGAMTQKAACDSQDNCDPEEDNVPAEGWRQLWTLVNSNLSTDEAIEWSTDIDWR